MLRAYLLETISQNELYQFGTREQKVSLPVVVGQFYCILLSQCFSGIRLSFFCRRTSKKCLRIGHVTRLFVCNNKMIATAPIKSVRARRCGAFRGACDTFGFKNRVATNMNEYWLIMTVLYKAVEWNRFNSD